MKKINKQSGFTLIELLVTLAIVSVIMVLGINKLRDYNDYKRMELQVKRLDDTATYIQNYTYNYGIPATFAQLTEKKYAPMCDLVGSKDCIPQNQTLWRSEILITKGDNDTVSLKIPVKKLSAKDRQYFKLQLRTRFPYVLEKDGYQTVTINLKTKTQWNSGGGSSKPVSGDYLMTNGSKKLTGDWDVGNKNITNVKDVLLSLNTDAGGATSVKNKHISTRAGVIRDANEVPSGTFVKMPTCSNEVVTDGAMNDRAYRNQKYVFQPQILYWFNGVTPIDYADNNFNSISAIKSVADPDRKKGYWFLWTSFNAYSSHDQRFELFNPFPAKGQAADTMTMPQWTRRANVTMGYITRCQLVEKV